jgi:hypothetical protein
MSYLFRVDKIAARRLKSPAIRLQVSHSDATADLATQVSLAGFGSVENHRFPG